MASPGGSVRCIFVTGKPHSAWVGARCWLGGRGRGLFALACDIIIGGLLHVIVKKKKEEEDEEEGLIAAQGLYSFRDTGIFEEEIFKLFKYFNRTP